MFTKIMLTIWVYSLAPFQIEETYRIEHTTPRIFGDSERRIEYEFHTDCEYLANELIKNFTYGVDGAYEAFLPGNREIVGYAATCETYT